MDLHYEINMILQWIFTTESTECCTCPLKNIRALQFQNNSASIKKKSKPTHHKKDLRGKGECKCVQGSVATEQPSGDNYSMRYI